MTRQKSHEFDIEGLFHKILMPALGCTEPAAVALAVAAAVQATSGWTPGSCSAPLRKIESGEVEDIQVAVSRNIFKNCFSIAIPNAEGHKGILMASALGAFCDPRKELELFSDLDSVRIRAAEQIISRNKVRVRVDEGIRTDVYIEAIVALNTARGSERGRCVICQEHSNIVSLTRGSEVIFSRMNPQGDDVGPDEDLVELKNVSIEHLVTMVEDLPDSVLGLIRRTIEMNTKAYEAGLAQPLGLGAGFYNVASGEAEDIFSIATRMSAAGSDARMSGYPVEVMSSAGSGNQGIVATIPVVVYARHRGVAEARLLRAVALSHLITMYLTQFIGYLSAFCGVAIKAGIGAACGVVYAMGGGADDIGRAVKVMASTLTGMICDGAKVGCALKVGTVADMAIRAALFAMEKMEVEDDNGIVASTAEETIRNLAELSRSMDAVDRKILDIMRQKITHNV
jgi:L-cysteine desulfidase